ncbi:MAG: hydroxymethylpyrimidine/phosphomethylpyrimidine kinase [Burkholderiales bacterium]
MKRASVLVFAGADPSGGAGIQADMLAITALGAHPLTVITVLTVQDNDRVFSIHPVSAALVQQQAQPLIDKIRIAAVKIGIVGNRANAEAIAEIVNRLRLQQPDLPVVFDPVLASGHGDPLAMDDALQAIAPLLPIATVVTPNLPEAQALCGGDRHADAQAEVLLSRGCKYVLIKGGHSGDGSVGGDPTVINRWFTAGDSRSWTWPRLPGSFHGSGCTLAAALAALLANGKSMPEALDLAQAYCHGALASAYSIAGGQSIPNRFSSLRE